ncbi:hypothetical protein SAMN05216186_12054 [Pseudomonas indica]|uniref:Uncharacterized protein n=2 Tax=Pseudomonas indica TaxID=137658 RepID=A0A1G9JVA5_9PSED|nr:hypothetical protein SAMN05216186_12054 [Pseudomonas indica]
MRAAMIAGLALLALAGAGQAMEALDDRELGEISGAGVGFFLDNFYYDQGSATARVTGLKDTQGNPLAIDFERAYIKGEGSQRGTLDTEASLGSPLHPFTLGVVSGAKAPTLPAGGQALQLHTPTWTDPLNDTHQYGLWSYYQGCLYGEAGCTDPQKAVNNIDVELNKLQSQRDQLLARYQSVGFLTLKSGIDQDMQVVYQRQAQVATETSDVQSAYGTMQTRYAAAPSTADLFYPKPAFGEKYGCGNICINSAARAYNQSVDAYQQQVSELAAAQKSLAEAWNTERDGYTLNQRATDYDEFSNLCGTPTQQQPSCAAGRVKKTQDNRSVLVIVATSLQNGGTRVKGLDIGIEATFTLPSTAYSGAASGATKGATSTRTDFFSINLEGFSLHGAYLNLWGDSSGLVGETSLQMYADKLIIGGCRNCSDANRAVAKNLYFDINLGHGTLQPLSLGVLSDGELRLSLPGVTWANHEAFYQQVPKSNISIGNLNIGGVDLGSQVVRGMRVDYLDVRTVSLPR